MNTLESLFEEAERKHARQSNKMESFTLQVENRFSKVNKEIKKLAEMTYKLNISLPTSKASVLNGSNH